MTEDAGPKEAIEETIFKKNESIQWTTPLGERPRQLFPMGESPNHPYKRVEPTKADVGVEGYDSVKTVTVPPPNQKRKRKKHRHGKSRHRDARKARAKAYEGGSRLVVNSKTGVREKNERTCLCEAIVAILPSNKNKELVKLVVTASMPIMGDTSIMRVEGALASHGLILNRVNAKYIKKNGAPYNLLQERKCRLVIGIKLTSLDGRPMNHFVGWDGTVIYDQPFASVVNEFRDRSSTEMSNAVFEKLYEKTAFRDWQVTAVYELVELKNILI